MIAYICCAAMCTAEQLRRHYGIERPLANVLRAPSREERPGLYNRLYDELYRLAPDHPQLLRRGGATQSGRGQGGTLLCSALPIRHSTRAQRAQDLCVIDR